MSDNPSSAQLKNILETGRVWGLESDLQQLVDRIARDSSELFGFERAAVVLIEEKGLNLRAVWPDTHRGGMHDISAAASAVIESGRPFFSFQENPAETEHNGFLLGFPLAGSQGIIGALLFETTDPERRLEEKEQDLLEILSRQAATAAEHSILYHSAITDPLTNLFSHRFFQLHLEKAIDKARRSKQNLSLIVADIDSFSRINSRYGRETADRCLVTAASILQNTFRCSDIIARSGTDEFEVALADTPGAGLQIAADKLVKQIESADIPGAGIVTVSCGGAVFPDNAVSARSLFIEACSAAQQAKHDGGNCVRLSDNKAPSLPRDTELRGKKGSEPLSSYPPQAPGEIIRTFRSIPAGGSDPESREQTEHFRILRHLGRGTMGESLLVYQPELERDVVLKRPRSASPSPRETEEFEREARITASLNHPGIVPVHTMGRDAEGRPYYTTNMTEGSALRSILDGRRNKSSVLLHEYTPARLIEILSRVAETLAYAHRRNAVHLNLSPDDIIVSEFGGVSVTGWGRTSGRDNGPQEQDLSLNRLAYRGPEFFIAGADTGPPSDVFSAGAVLYEVLTGHPPYIRDSVPESLESLKSGSLIPPEQRVTDSNINPSLVKLCTEMLDPDPLERPPMDSVSEVLSRSIRGEQEMEILRFGEQDIPVDPGEWICLLGEWEFRNGEFVSAGEKDSFLIWRTGVTAPYRIICEGWSEGTGELSVIAGGPDPEDPYRDLYQGYCFEFGSEANTCTKLARNGYDVLARPGLVFEPGRKYRIEIEYSSGWIHCSVDNRRVFSYRELFPLPGKHVGFYGYESGSHIRPLEIHRPKEGITLPTMHIADELYNSSHYNEALDRYSDIAESGKQGLEKDEARLKAGMCLNMLGRKERARDMYGTIRDNALEPFARAAEALLDLDRQPDSDPSRGIKALDQLLTAYPGHQAVAMIIPPAFAARLYNVHLKPGLPLDEECRLKADLLKLGADSIKPPTQTQVRCQTYSAYYRFFSGMWEQALTDMLEFSNLLSPDKMFINNFHETLMAAALANGREDILPSSPDEVDKMYNCQIARWYPYFLFHMIVRRYSPQRFAEEILSDTTNFSPDAWDELTDFPRTLNLAKAVLACHLHDNNTRRARMFIDNVLIPVSDMRFQKEYLHLPVLFWTGTVLLESGEEDLFSMWMDYCSCFTRGTYEYKTRARGVITYLQTRFMIEHGMIREAASYIKGKKVPLVSQRPTIEPVIVLQTFFSSLRLLDTPSEDELKKQRTYNLAGPELDLCRIFTGEQDPEPGPFWPHPLWRPELRLWLGLWLEHKGENRKAEETVRPCVDERYGSSFCQPAIKALLERTGG